MSEVLKKVNQGGSVWGGRPLALPRHHAVKNLAECV